MSTIFKQKDDCIISSSFSSEDLTLLLNQATGSPVSVEEKEQLVASGGHYSDVFVKEGLLSESLKKAYDYALNENKGARRLAYHIQFLAKEIVAHSSPNKPLVLISLVRAGVPLGVLLTRYIRRNFPEVSVKHYGISIIRDRGIDQKALETIHKKNLDSIHYFIDGWTGKGSISYELRHALRNISLPFDFKLVVDSDPAKTATHCATYEDWLIPFGLVGAQISGLFSRTLWADNSYHMAAYFSDLEKDDISSNFIETVEKYTEEVIVASDYPADCSLKNSATAELFSDVSASEVIKEAMDTFNLSSIHKVKPGIAEATRAIHRRTPRLIILRTAQDPETNYIKSSAEEKGVPIQYGLSGGMGPFRAITILK
ncbi:MAG: hypothetical protein CMH98_20960 [Oceanospirillaceae bacterium]|nr:hypothetical protein [Oceanospirillaceae bacterium]